MEEERKRKKKPHPKKRENLNYTKIPVPEAIQDRCKMFLLLQSRKLKLLDILTKPHPSPKHKDQVAFCETCPRIKKKICHSFCPSHTYSIRPPSEIYSTAHLLKTGDPFEALAQIILPLVLEGVRFILRNTKPVESCTFLPRPEFSTTLVNSDSSISDRNRTGASIFTRVTLLKLMSLVGCYMYSGRSQTSAAFQHTQLKECQVCLM